jgi:ankyrin repeat protein
VLLERAESLAMAVQSAPPWSPASAPAAACKRAAAALASTVRTTSAGRVAAGANANGVSGLLQSALHCASWRGHARVALALLEGKFESEGGVLANLQDCYGASALMRAAWHGHEEVVRLLLSRGADQTLQSKRGGRCAMHRAAYTGRSGVVALLCAAPGAAAARALRDRDGKTPLDVAVEHGRAACAAVLRGGE